MYNRIRSVSSVSSGATGAIMAEEAAVAVAVAVSASVASPSLRPPGVGGRWLELPP